MPNLTLAICVYNTAKYIKDTLQSVALQTMQDFHLLVVDDCSTDGSVAAIKVFFEEHPRQYELVCRPVNGGLCNGRRFVEENATTKYIMFVDADDILYPQAVETLYNKISSDKDLMAVGCYLEYINEKGERIGGTGGNIYYAWALMMVMTCVKYFHDNQENPDIYEDEIEEEDSKAATFGS